MELLFYKQIAAIDKDKHRHLRVGAIKDFRFTAETNSVPLASVEFIEAAKEYPIVFAGRGSPTPVPAALLGLRSNENLILRSDGKWDARYVPAFIRRYPFVLASADQEQFVVCLDEGHPAVGAKEGEALFTHEGEPTPYLNNAIAFLRDFQAEAQRTRDFMKRLLELDLLNEVSARAELTAGAAYQLSGFSVVSEPKLRALDKDVIDELFRKGWLALIDAHLLSLGNLGRLVERLSKAKPKAA
ncbi:MAG: SapC family protein [Rhodocyclaceae bacterium]|nr:SapC family protein [Rhodocyclaceae bacterium]